MDAQARTYSVWSHLAAMVFVQVSHPFSLLCSLLCASCAPGGPVVAPPAVLCRLRSRLVRRLGLFTAEWRMPQPAKTKRKKEPPPIPPPEIKIGILAFRLVSERIHFPRVTASLMTR